MKSPRGMLNAEWEAQFRRELQTWYLEARTLPPFPRDLSKLSAAEFGDLLHRTRADYRSAIRTLVRWGNRAPADSLDVFDKCYVSRLHAVQQEYERRQGTCFLTAQCNVQRVLFPEGS